MKGNIVALNMKNKLKTFRFGDSKLDSFFDKSLNAKNSSGEQTQFGSRLCGHILSGDSSRFFGLLAYLLLHHCIIYGPNAQYKFILVSATSL